MKKTILLSACLIIGVFSLWQITNVFAEKVGSSPESSSTSRIKTLDNELISLGVGTTASGAWGDWGIMWNRIYSSANWIPSGTASVGDVALGVTFYGNSRTKQTGTAAVPVDYSQQSLVKWDDAYGGDETGEEASWTNTAGSATTGVWKDNRTGLYWSVGVGSLANQFTIATCDFFTTTPRGNYAGTDNDCGGAINKCGTYSLEAVTGQGAKTDWYLPSQKELMQAYMDGIYNQNATFATTSLFWSSTELSFYSAGAWLVDLAGGDTSGSTKTDSYTVRCVRRD